MDHAQRRAIRNYRSRLRDRGLARFEVLGRTADRDLIRALARRLAEDGPETAQLRTIVGKAVEDAPAATGGILAALRRSPLVDAGLDLERQRHGGRKVTL